MRILFLLLLLSLKIAQPSYGQGKARAQRFLNLAQTYYSQKDTNQAFSYIQLAIDEYPAYDEAYSLLGKWLFDAKNYIWSARTFSTAAVKCVNGKSRFALPASRSFAKAQMPDSALFWLSQSPSKNTETEKIAAQSKLALSFLRPLDTNQARKLDIRVNTKVPEFCPTISADGQTLYFTRRINGVNEDFYYAKADSCGGWFTARNMGYPPNTASNESAQSISADDHYLFFMRGDNRSENGWGRGGYDLYLAYRLAADSPWTAAESFGATINTPAYEGMPSLSPSISDLYFISDKPGGYGGLDIWISHFSFGLWQLPVNLGPNINTAGNETAPFISSDNKTLYFASDGHPGLGGSDLFMSKKESGSSLWSTPTNLGVPINSSADEHSVFVCPDGKRTFFASDRGNTNGNLDIYESTLPSMLSPEGTAFAMCYVYDSFSKEPVLLGSITLYDIAGNELGQYHANKGDGSILMSLPMGKTFNYEVRGFNYTMLEGTISFPEACPKWCTINFPLLSRDYVKPTQDSLVLTLFYPKNVTKLSDSQIILLKTALQDWLGKKDVSIFINGYTDNTGTPMINIQKSTIRANLLYEVISAMGFEPQTLTSTGFGDSNPLVENSSPENQDKNRRVEIVVRW